MEISRKAAAGIPSSITSTSEISRTNCSAVFRILARIRILLLRLIQKVTYEAALLKKEYTRMKK